MREFMFHLEPSANFRLTQVFNLFPHLLQTGTPAMRPVGVTTLTPNQAIRGTAQRFVARQKSPIGGQTVKLVHGAGGTQQLVSMATPGVHQKIITNAVSSKRFLCLAV